MTTNLGVTARQSTPFGFASAAEVFTADQVMRAVAQTYRPEFQNRIDKVIVFRPLTRDLMRIILKKELKEVLERRGLKDRAWAVEWEDSALELLLEKGFSPDMGARPLKRAIDQYVVAPLAETIVERRFPEGEQFLFFRSDGSTILAEFVDPDSGAAPAATAAREVGSVPALASMILKAHGTRAEFEALMAEAASVHQSLASPEWEALKAVLSKEMSEPQFWGSGARFGKLARLALMDRVAAASETAGALQRRLERSGGREQYSRDLVGRLALQLHLLKQGIQDVTEAAPVEVALCVMPALEGSTVDKSAGDARYSELFAMYRAWCSKRHMQSSELDCGGARPVLVVSGFGAHRVLLRECGVHVFELAGSGLSRAMARVQVVATPLGDVPATKLQAQVLGGLDGAPRPSRVARRYRREPTPLVRNADGSRRSRRLDAVLGGDFDLLSSDDPERLE
ncbi:MAG: hypothetical protein ACJ8F3_10440 [Xanthobacteraceae bacterium]